MGADTRPGDRAESQKLAGQRKARHQRRLHHHSAGEGEILDLRGGEDHRAGVEGGVHVWAAAWRAGERLPGREQPTDPNRNAPGSHGAGPLPRTGGGPSWEGL